MSGEMQGLSLVSVTAVFQVTSIFEWDMRQNFDIDYNLNISPDRQAV